MLDHHHIPAQDYGAVAAAIVEAVIDDLRHTDNMTGRINNFYFGNEDDWYDYHELVKVAEWMAERLEMPVNPDA